MTNGSSNCNNDNHNHKLVPKEAHTKLKEKEDSTSASLKLETSCETDNLEHKRQRRKPYGVWRRFCTITCLTTAASLCILGLISLRFTLFDMFMTERLRMTPGLPPFQLWKNPKPEVRCRIHIFTVTNANSFLNGSDTKIKFKEFGPIVYREKLHHTDVVFHENSTMSYTVHRDLEFASELNVAGILNETITVPNIVLLGMAAVLQDYSFTMKIGFRFMSQKDSVFVNTTVFNYLWNFTTPAFLSAQQFVPFMVHQDNGGAMYNIYKGYKDRVTVRMGTENGYSRFFLIDKFNGKPTVPGFAPENGDCFASLQNSSEGALYPSFLTKNSTPHYWRKTVCRPIPLTFEEEVTKGSLQAYKYEAKENVYDRYENEMADCYSKSGEKYLPDGLSDISKCYNGLPVAISLPHFLGRDGYWNDHAEGFNPSKEKHGSYSIIEPTTGVPMEQLARSQCNLILPELTFFTEQIELFSETVIPMVWIEYHQEKLTPFIIGMLVFTVNILPVLQYFISALLLLCGGFYLYVGINRLELERRLRQLEMES